MNLLKEKNIHLEICPTSSIMTSSAQNFTDHPAIKIIVKGISISINTDDPSVEHTTEPKEYDIAVEYFKINAEETVIKSIDYIFKSDLREELREKIRKNWNN